MTSRRPRLFSRKCDTCVFHPGNMMHLAPGRLLDLVESNQQHGAMLVCHKTTYGQHPEIGETMCRGYFDAYAEGSMVPQVMEWLFGPEWYEEVDPPSHSE